MPFDPRRKVRTAEHVVADLSYNFLERKVLRRGHWLDAPPIDYGIDATMFHHDEHGEIENGEVRFQLKASRRIEFPSNKRWLPQRVSLKDIRYWCFELFPVILISYDDENERAYWLHIQSYVSEHPEIMEADAGTVTLRIPRKNKLTLLAIDHFRILSLNVVRSLLHRGTPET